MKRYEHSQLGHTIIWVALAVAVFIAITGISWRVDPGTSLIVEGIVLICAILFWKLTIKIENETLEWSFGIGLIRKQVPIVDIAACEPIQIRGCGWGIRLTPYGWLYNVSGLDAVAIRLRNGRKFALGTDDPQGLVNAIQRFSSAE
ncbi:MAG TPA: hypothetical protein VH330_02240 [Candidatus Udaeobacter sp.]